MAEPLHLMPIETWGEIRKVLSADFPRSLSGYTFLETIESIIKIGLDYGVKVFCPFGNINNGIVVLNIKASVKLNIFQHLGLLMTNADNQAKSEYKTFPTEENLTKYKKLRNHCKKNPAKIWKLFEGMGINKARDNILEPSLNLSLLNTVFTTKTYYEVIIQCPIDDTTELEEALKSTNVIDWTQKIEVPFAPKNVRDCVVRIINERNYKIDDINMTESFILLKNSSPFNIRLASDLSFKFLTIEYTEIVNNAWPHKYPGSDWYFDLLIKANLGYGLFKGNDLMSWVFIKEMGALGHLYTLEKYRRKGYGELVLKLISNILLNQGKYVVAFCVEGNEKADRLYKKLGFKSVQLTYWCNFQGY